MMETGILEYFERRYPPVNDTCTRIKEEMAKARALTMHEAGAAFLVLGAGISIAMTALFLELIIRSVQNAFSATSATESMLRVSDLGKSMDHGSIVSFSNIRS